MQTEIAEIYTSNQYSQVPAMPESFLPGINQTYGDSQMTPTITAVQGWWDDVTQLGSDAFELSGKIGQGLFEAMDEAYERGSSALGRVVRDATGITVETAEALRKPVEGIAGTTVFYVAILVGVLGVAIYYGGKSGGLRVSV